MKPPRQDLSSTQNVVTITLFHGTTPSGLLGILRDKHLKPGDPEEGGAGLHGVYGRGFLHSDDRKWQKESYHQQLLHCWRSAKNQAWAVFEATAAGEHSTIGSGGVIAESWEVTPTRWAHNTRNKRWIVHRDALSIKALVFDENILLPAGLRSEQHYHATAGYK